MSTTVSYKGSTIATVTNQTKTLSTAGKWLEGDITLVDSTNSGTAAISVVDTTDSHGGTVRTITALDISDTTAVASDVAQGKYFYTAQGVKTAGTASSGGGSTLTTKTITANGTYNASSDNADGYSSVVVNVSGGGTPSATAHTVYFEFADSTNTTLTGYWNDSFISSAITATTPTTYNNKTVTLAQLDGTTWYEPTAIPIGVELIDFTKVVNDYVINSSGEVVAEQWYSVTDYTSIDPSMTFSYSGCRWYNLAVYDSQKTLITTANMYNITTESTYNSNVGDGVLTPADIPSNAAYIRITGTYNPQPGEHELSLIRTA